MSNKKFNRICALESCGKEFSTDDTRKVYHSRACGNAARSQRWYEAAAAAKRKIDGKKGAKHIVTKPVNAHGRSKAKAKVVKAKKSKPKVKAKAKRKAKPAAVDIKSAGAEVV